MVNTSIQIKHGKKSTTPIGTNSEAQILAALVRIGKNVLIPFGEQLKYDLAIDEQGKLIRVQCKTGRYRKGVIECRLYSVPRAHNRCIYNAEQVDIFGIYCPELHKVYLLPLKDAQGQGSILLRVDPTKNKQGKFIKWAKDYEI